MSNLDQEYDREELNELLQEEFNPDLFYQALNNALAQLENYQEVEAA
ncbi:MAG: hypothetical protein AAF541_16925 [Pseudomonadota bacterium]